MNTLAVFLLSITGSLVGRVLLSLGIGIFSYAALTTFTTMVISQAQDKYSAIDATVLQLLNLGGVGDFLGIIAAAMVTRASLMAIKKLRPM